MSNYYKHLYRSMIGASFATVILTIGSRHSGSLALAAIFVALLSMLGVLYFSFKIKSEKGNSHALWSGIALIVISTLLDVGSTLFYSPDLALEGNPFARFFLDAGMHHRYVIIVGLVLQLALLLATCFIWSSFCGNYDEYLKRVWEYSKHKGGHFLSMYGTKGKGLLSPTGSVDPFLFVNGLAPLLLGVYLFRIYLALEWNGMVPISRLAAPIIIIAITMTVQYFQVEKSLKAYTRKYIVED